jgi:Type II secretion system (T2SS), protein E, N-terminal domain
MPRKRLGTMLLEAGVISDDGLRHALAEQKRWGRSLGQTVVELKLVSESELVHVLSQQLGVPVVEIDLIDVPFAVLELVPAAFAQQHDLVPFAVQMKFLDVAMADPADTQVIEQLQIKTKLNVRAHLAGPKAIERAMAKYYARGFAQQGRKDLSLTVGRGDELELELADDPVPIDPISARDEELLDLQDRVARLESQLGKLVAELAAKGIVDAGGLR